MLSRPVLLVAVIFLSTVASPLYAVAPTAEVPEALKPWVEWVLDGHQEDRCPVLLGGTTRLCAWPSRLSLDLDDHGGRLRQDWAVYRDQWVALPGDAHGWPEEVHIDGRETPVIDQSATPHVWMTTGKHEVTASFVWSQLPEKLPIAAEVALLDLKVRGRRIAFPYRDDDGVLWLQEATGGEEKEEDSLAILVHRKVVDEIPMLLATSIELRVAGSGREVLLAKVLPDGFVPADIESQLPTRIEGDGRLRVQLQAGTWSIKIAARHDRPLTTLTLPVLEEGEWDDEEVWSFEAHPDLRVVAIEGVASIDPQQTEMPEAWRGLPAYRMRPGDTLTLTERQRGDANPAPDQLTLKRIWWLDFDGAGYSIKDAIGGTASRTWRLEALPPTVLGRVSIGGHDQFLTRISDTAPVGVEIRQGEVDLAADSRVEGSIRETPAVGWDSDFQQVEGQLNLPPGWQLLHAGGVDEAMPTWIARWSLLDLFVVLITTISFARLWGWLYGGLALAVLGLTFTEPDAPAFVWLAVLAAEALVQLLPEGRARKALQALRAAALLALVAIALPFLVSQVRHAIYPGLGWQGAVGEPAAPDSAAAFFEARARQNAAPQPSAGMADSLAAARSAAMGKKAAYLDESDEAALRYTLDPNTVVQTGAGLPDWRGETIYLNWRGPVQRGQQLRLVLLSPLMTFGAALVRSGLLFLLLVAALKNTLGGSIRLALPRSAAAVLVAMAASVVPSGSARADFPSADLLNDLRDRLLKAPECAPNCAGSSLLEIDVSATTLRARWIVEAGTDVAVPLPGHADQWNPSSIALDDHPASAAARHSDGHLWVFVPQGKHILRLEGTLPDRDQVQIALPLKPHRVEVRGDAWRVDGLHDDGAPDDNLQFTRIRSDDDEAGSGLQPNVLPPFATVTRSIELGLTWTIHTTVQRMSPFGTAIVLEVPLLPGEAVVSGATRVVNGRALVNIAPQDALAEWRSTISTTSQLRLQAAEPGSYAEIWELNASPIWHVTTSGTPEVQLQAGAEPRIRRWRPWPSEEVAIEISRPVGIGGQTITIDRSKLTITPGLRATDAVLDLTVRSSRGAQHTIHLPPSVELQSVTIDDLTQPIRQQGDDVTLPLKPGEQKVRLTWRDASGITTRLTTPGVRLNAPSNNAELDVPMPANRWTLFVGGPRLGPAVLFWSHLLVVIAVAIVLSRVPLTPLRAHHWSLLGVGLTQVPIWAAMIVVGWLLALGWRRDNGEKLSTIAFDLAQIQLVAWTIVALGCVVFAIHQGLLGFPEMQIAGNWSQAQDLRWYQDRVGDELPRAWVISVPLWIYRLAMLAWALWLAQALLSWLRWGWDCFSTGGLWHSRSSNVIAP